MQAILKESLKGCFKESTWEEPDRRYEAFFRIDSRSLFLRSGIRARAETMYFTRFCRRDKTKTMHFTRFCVLECSKRMYFMLFCGRLNTETMFFTRFGVRQNTENNLFYKVLWLCPRCLVCGRVSLLMRVHVGRCKHLASDLPLR